MTVSTWSGRTLLVLAASAPGPELTGALARVSQAGARLRLGRLEPGPAAGSLPWESRHTLDARQNPSRLHRLAVSALDAARVGDRVARAARHDRWLQRAARGSDAVVLADESVAPVAPVLDDLAPGVPVLDAPSAVAVLTGTPVWDRLGSVLAGIDPVSDEHDVTGLLDALGQVAGVPRLPWVSGEDLVRWLRPVLGVAHELVRFGQHETLDRLWEAVRALDGVGARELDGLGLTALERSTRISSNATPLSAVVPSDQIPVARRVLDAADVALEAGDVGFAADLAAASLRLVFNRDMHADVPQTPLVDSPAEFLAPLVGSRMWQLLTSVQPRRPAPEREPHPQGRTRVLVLPGAYPRFARPVTRALREHPGTDVEVVDLPDVHRHFQWVGINRHALGIRLRHALGREIEQGAEVLPVLDRADVVVADWADRGAMWASLMVPEGTRLVVRVHSMDSLSPWLHLLDWTKVDDVVFVSVPIRDLTADALGERMPARVHVIGNGIDLDRFRPDESLREPRTLGMIGWSRPVKDPLFSLEVLAGLRERDPDGGWRLRLVGPDLEYGNVEQISAYRRAFHARVLDAGLLEHVDFVDKTVHVDRYVTSFGFLLSTSVRESFHSAVVEGAAAGAVPVVRDWPILARRDGAAQIYPREWIVSDVDQAVERIWALRDPTDRAAAATDVVRVVHERFDLRAFDADICRVVLGGARRDAACRSEREATRADAKHSATEAELRDWEVTLDDGLD